MALWLTVGVYAVTSLAALRTSVLSVLITLLVGRVDRARGALRRGLSLAAAAGRGDRRRARLGRRSR